MKPARAVVPGTSERLDGLTVRVGAFATIEVIVAVRLTIPLKGPTPVRLIVEMPAEPATTVNDRGFAEMVKSTTLTDRLTECASEPILPVTVTA